MLKHSVGKLAAPAQVPISILAYRPSFDLANICNRYLTGVVENPVTPVRRRYSIKTVKGTGEKLKDIIFDDAHGGSGTCQVSALLLLDPLVALTRAEKSNYIIDSLMRTNFLSGACGEHPRNSPRASRDHATGEPVFTTPCSMFCKPCSCCTC